MNFSFLTAPLSGKTTSEIVGFILIIAAIIGYGEYRRYELVNYVSSQTVQEASSTAAIQSQLTDIQSQLAYITAKDTIYDTILQNQQSSSAAVQEQIGQVSSMVTSINKLSETDPQLLQKYSKVYFLSENYVPASLSTIPTQYTWDKNTKYQFLTQALPFLQNMIDAGTKEGVHLEVISAYRSFGTQSSLKSSYDVTYGAGTANSFSAEQGYSEHQLGTAVDLTTPTVAATFTGFEDTAEYTWLLNNAYKYGFVLSYPKGNQYYEYEPWHWRFVGTALATKLHTEGKYFYDFDQRTIDDYLLVLFD